VQGKKESQRVAKIIRHYLETEDDTSQAELSYKPPFPRPTKVRDAQDFLKARNPEQVRLLAETAKGSLQTIQNARSDAQTEQTEVHRRG